jgi:glycosyltransferase involved in cell wall biosynthesis
MSRYLLDVLLPFHVYDDLLQEAIESCKKSLPANSRIIAINTLVDQKILNMHSDQILELVCPKADYVTALRFGLSKTQSKYVALMNSDDLIHESRFINQIQALENSNFKMCVTNLSKFSITKQQKWIEIPALLGDPPSNFHEALLLLGSFRADASWCFNQEWAHEVNLFGQESDVSDWCTAMRTINGGNTIILSEDQYFYRMHSGQITRSERIPNSDFFYSNWKTLNQRLNFRSLTFSEIDAITSKGKQDLDLDHVWKWLRETEAFLISVLPDSDKKKISNIFSRRRLLICIHQRTLRLRIKDLLILPKVLFQYIRFKKYLRVSL